MNNINTIYKMSGLTSLKSCRCDTCPDGAVIRSNDGKMIYKGQTNSQNLPHGLGCLDDTYKNQTYSGQFINGNFSYGEVNYRGSHKYRGSFDENQKPHGIADEIFEDGIAYRRQFDHGQLVKSHFLGPNDRLMTINH